MQIRTGRREMLGTFAGGALIALPVGLFLVSCSSSDSSNGDSSAPQKNGTKIVYTSSSEQSHTHTFALQGSDVSMPTASGVSGSTSTNSGHAHEVSISMEQLQSIGSGESVKITT